MDKQTQLKKFFLGIVFFLPLLPFAPTLFSQANEKEMNLAKVQLCLILDVSGSMEGLLAQAQNEIWKTINYLEDFQKDTLETQIELAILSYGNALYENQGHVFKVSDFSNNLDRLAAGLFTMLIGGSNEYAGQAIRFARDSLSWDTAAAFKSIIIAGNESFDQGEINFEDAIQKANKDTILINTIFCGSWEGGITLLWEKAAQLGKGDYTSIDQGIDIDTFKTPYDHTLVKFYFDYNSTYFDQSQQIQELQKRQFDVKGEISPAFRDMLIYKDKLKKKEPDFIDKFNQSNWDFSSIKKEALPPEWQKWEEKKIKIKLLEWGRKRQTFAEGFETYTQKIEEFLALKIEPQLDQKTLDTAIKEMIGTQLIQVGFLKEQ